MFLIYKILIIKEIAKMFQYVERGPWFSGMVKTIVGYPGTEITLETVADHDILGR